MAPVPLSPSHRRWLLLFARTAYGVLAAATFGGALYVWSLRCEGFGCIGLGIAWAGWVGVLYVPALLAGAWLVNPRPDWKSTRLNSSH